jgi:hypothetical protein
MDRNQISHVILSSRIQNSGGVYLEIFDMIMSWSNFDQFPLRDETKVLKHIQEFSILLTKAIYLKQSKNS